MSKLNLLFVSFVVFALATASVERNLRFLGEEEERELNNGDGSTTSNDDGGSESSAATTPVQTTETTTTPAVTTTPSSSGSEATTTEPGETTTSSSDKNDGTIPTVNPTTFRCYLDEPPTYSNDTGFKVEKLLCNIPEATTTPEITSETTTTPAETTTAHALGRMLADGNIEVTIEEITGVKCTANPRNENGNAITLICKTGSTNGFNYTDYRFTAVYSGSKSVVYLGCKLGNDKIIPVVNDGTIVSGDECPSPLVGESPYNTTCKFDKTQIGTGDEYKLDTSNMTCLCGNSVTYKDVTYSFSTEELDGDKNRVGTTNTVVKSCKKTGSIEFKCKSTGWEYISGSESCNNDGAISSTISSILLGVIMIFAIVF